MGCTGRPTQEDLELIRTRKPEEPKLEVTLKDGSKRNVWCTFGPQQIDIDINSRSGHPSTRLWQYACTSALPRLTCPCILRYLFLSVEQVTI